MKMQGNLEDSTRYVGPGPSYEIEENFDEHQYLDCDALAQVLLDQECVYRSFETNYGNHHPGACFTINSHGKRGMDRNERSLPKGDSLDAKNAELQLAIDESLAIALQETEFQALRSSSSDAARSETSRTASASDRGRNSTAGTSNSSQERNSIANTSRALKQDNIDPDSMTYEELLFIGEAIGTHSHDLSEMRISSLPTSKYKAWGLFSRKNKHEECAICCIEYKRGDRLITLPCQHPYHADCVKRWLKIKKVCPLCYAEVFGS